jgi:hypothetical protein
MHILRISRNVQMRGFSLRKPAMLHVPKKNLHTQTHTGMVQVVVRDTCWVDQLIHPRGENETNNISGEACKVKVV